MARKNSKVVAVAAGAALLNAAVVAATEQAALNAVVLAMPAATVAAYTANYDSPVVADYVADYDKGLLPAPVANRAAGPSVGYVGAVLAALAGGPLTVAALATSAGCSAGGVRNAIDNIRRARGKGFVVSMGGGVFSL